MVRIIRKMERNIFGLECGKMLQNRMTIAYFINLMNFINLIN